MHKRMMDKAIEQAKLALLCGDVPVGAVVAYEGNIVACAHNEREKTGDPTAHAEVLAIRRAAQALHRRRLDGCTLYVTLEPCPMCAGAIAMSGIERVYFGAYDLRMGCAGSVYSLPEDSALGVHIPCVGGVCEQDCAKLVNDFFTVRRT